MYGLFVNYAAGEHFIQVIAADELRDVGYFTCIAEFETWEEAEAKVQEMREESKVFAVFFNHAAGEGFVSVEDCFSGNWRGSKYGHYSLIGEYKTEEEANRALDELMKPVEA
jgi:hypothetical protein